MSEPKLSVELGVKPTIDLSSFENVVETLQNRVNNVIQSASSGDAPNPALNSFNQQMNEMQGTVENAGTSVNVMKAQGRTKSEMLLPVMNEEEGDILNEIERAKNTALSASDSPEIQDKITQIFEAIQPILGNAVSSFVDKLSDNIQNDNTVEDAQAQIDNILSSFHETQKEKADAIKQELENEQKLGGGRISDARKVGFDRKILNWEQSGEQDWEQKQAKEVEKVLSTIDDEEVKKALAESTNEKTDQAGKSLKSLGDNLRDTAENANKTETGFVGLISKMTLLHQAMGLVNRGMDAYIFHPKVVDAQITANKMTAFDYTDTASATHQQYQSEVFESTKKRQLEAEQTSMWWGTGGTVLGGLLGALTGTPMGVTAGAMIGGTIGNQVGKYFETDAQTKNIEEQAKYEQTIKDAQQSASIYSSSKNPLLSGNILGDTTTLMHDETVRDILMLNTANKDKDEESLKANISIGQQAYGNVKGQVMNFMPYWIGKENLRTLSGDSPSDIKGYTNQEDVANYENAVRQAGGSDTFDKADYKHLMNIATNTGNFRNPQSALRALASTQITGEQGEADTLYATAYGMTKEMYGGSSKNANVKTASVWDSIEGILKDILAVNKEAKFSDAMNLANLPKLLFGDNNAYGRIDQKGGDTINAIKQILNPSSTAHEALLYGAYGGGSPLEFEIKKLRGMSDPKNIESALNYIKLNGEGSREIVGGMLSGMGIKNPEILDKFSDLLSKGSVNVHGNSNKARAEYEKSKGTIKDLEGKKGKTAEEQKELKEAKKYKSEFESGKFVTDFIRTFEDIKKELLSGIKPEDTSIMQDKGNTPKTATIQENWDNITKSTAEVWKKTVVETETALQKLRSSFLTSSGVMASVITMIEKGSQNLGWVVGRENSKEGKALATVYKEAGLYMNNPIVKENFERQPTAEKAGAGIALDYLTKFIDDKKAGVEIPRETWTTMDKLMGGQGATMKAINLANNDTDSQIFNNPKEVENFARIMYRGMLENIEKKTGIDINVEVEVKDANNKIQFQKTNITQEQRQLSNYDK